MAETKTEATPENAAGGDTTPAVSKPRRTKLVKVQQRYIDCLLKRVPRRPFPTLSDEAIDIMYSTPEDRERFRKFQAENVALLKRLRDEDNAILEQYHTYGFAMQEVEIRDGQED